MNVNTLLNGWALTGAIVVALTAANSAAAAPQTYSLKQAGWSSGGEVNGYFSGEDLDKNGFLELFNGEISAYSVSFTGNDYVPAFTHNLSDLKFFSYTIGSPGFRPSFPLFSCGSGYFYDADDYMIGLCTNGVQDLQANTWTWTGQNALVAAELPEPSTLSVMAFGLMAASVAVRRRRKATD